MPAPDAIRPVGAGSVLGGRYRLVRLIAQGGMAAVWEAHDGVLARAVALKLLHPHLAADQVFLERFRREAVSAARLSHPNVVATFDAGITPDGTAFIVMELIRGQTLSVFEAQYRPVPGPICIEIGKQIADALAHAHAAGLVHRDVKPANVMVCDTGVGGPPLVKVTDFGIAKAAEGLGLELTKTGIVLGTPRYLSPEQIAGKEPDARADIYALGLVLFELITGRTPFAGPTEMAVAVQHLNDEPPRLRELRANVPPALDALVAQMLAKQPEDRPQSAMEVRRALLAIEAQGRSARAGRSTGAAVAPSGFGLGGPGRGPAGGTGAPSVPPGAVPARAAPGAAGRPPVVSPVGPGVFVPGGSAAGAAEDVAAAGPRVVPPHDVGDSRTSGTLPPGAALDSPPPPAGDSGVAIGSPWRPEAAPAGTAGAPWPPYPRSDAGAADWFAPEGYGAPGRDFSSPQGPYQRAPYPGGLQAEDRTSPEWPAGGRGRIAEYDPSSRRLPPPRPGGAPTRRRINSAGWLVSILVTAALIVVIIVAADHGSGHKPNSVSSTSSAAAKPIVIQNASVFHLERDADDSQDVGNAIDGNPNTAWQTDIYNTPSYAGLRPQGLGLALTLGSSQALHQLKVTSPTMGWSAEVFVANGVPDPPSLGPLGSPLAAQQGINGSTVFNLDGHKGQAILLWITYLGPSDRVAIAEVSAS
ncbi:MAG: protein kinase domain-containing protein [Acidimicrobiales bacterium]